MPSKRGVQRQRVSGSPGSNPAKRAGNNESYRPEPAQERTVRGVACCEIDGSRLADLGRQYKAWGLT